MPPWCVYKPQKTSFEDTWLCYVCWHIQAKQEVDAGRLLFHPQVCHCHLGLDWTVISIITSSADCYADFPMNVEKMLTRLLKKQQQQDVISNLSCRKRTNLNLFRFLSRVWSVTAIRQSAKMLSIVFQNKSRFLTYFVLLYNNNKNPQFGLCFKFWFPQNRLSHISQQRIKTLVLKTNFKIL